MLLLLLAGPAPRQASGNQPAQPPKGGEPAPATQFSGEEVSVGYVLVPVLASTASPPSGETATVGRRFPYRARAAACASSPGRI